MAQYNSGKNHPRFINLSGKIVGKLTILEYIHKENSKGNKRWIWKCQCSCGEICYIRTDILHLNKGQNSCRRCSDKIRGQKKILPNFQSLKNNLYQQYKYAAINRDYKFDLTIEEVLEIVSQNCYFCNHSPRIYKGDLDYIKSGKEFKRNGIDRLDNTKGYFKENCVPCCTTCNISKQEKSKDEFFKWIEDVYVNLVKKKSSTTIL